MDKGSLDGFEKITISGCMDHIVSLAEKEMHKVFVIQAKIYGANKLVKKDKQGESVWGPAKLIRQIIQQYLLFNGFITYYLL